MTHMLGYVLVLPSDPQTGLYTKSQKSGPPLIE